MRQLKLPVFALCLAIAFLAVPSNANADVWDKKTAVTFKVPVEIPGVGAQILPAGRYVFKLMDSPTNRNIVQIFNEDQSHLFATILAVPNYRLKPTDKTVITFRERPTGEPEAIRAWFYPGNSWGQEFVYPKERALEIAKVTDFPVLSMPAELATNLTLPATEASEPTVVALKEAPIEAVQPSGEVVPITEVVEEPPVQTEAAAEAPTPQEEESLPETASLLPIVGLVGLLSLIAGFALWILPIRRAL